MPFTPARIESLSKYAVHPNPESREGKLLISIMKKLGVTSLPTWEEIFESHFLHDLKAVPLEEMAVFNNDAAFMNASTPAGKVLNEVTGCFGAQNVLNLQAEIHEAQVQKVLEDLLVDRKLYNPVKAFTISDFPASKKNVEGFYQIFDGRHRIVALAILFGFKAKIPLWVDATTYSKACYATVRMNMTRQTFKLETVAVSMLKSKSAALDPAKQLEKFAGKRGRIAQWIVGKLVIEKDLQHFPKHSLVVTERTNREIHSITVVNTQNLFKAMLEACDDAALKDFNALVKFTEPGIKMFSAAFTELPKLLKERSTKVFNAYSSVLWGRIMGETLVGLKGKSPEAAGRALARDMAEFMNEVGEDWMARNPHSVLLVRFREFKNKIA